MGFPDRNDDPGNHTMGKRCGGMGNGRVSSLGKKPLGSCISPKDDIASVQKVEGKHLTFPWTALGMTNYFQQQTAHQTPISGVSKP